MYDTHARAPSERKERLAFIPEDLKGSGGSERSRLAAAAVAYSHLLAEPCSGSALLKGTLQPLPTNQQALNV